MPRTIRLQASEEGFSVAVPGLPGCWSQGATEAQALESLREAIVGYLAVFDELDRAERPRRPREAGLRREWVSRSQRRSLLRTMDTSISRARKRGLGD